MILLKIVHLQHMIIKLKIFEKFCINLELSNKMLKLNLLSNKLKWLKNYTDWINSNLIVKKST